MAEFKTIYIEEGNALREVQTDYDFEEYRRRKKEDEERRLREKRKAKLKRARRKKVQSINATIAIIFCVAFFVGYIFLQTRVSERVDNIAELETQISALKADNGATEARINTSANLANVRNTALNELGMVYAGADKIVYYDIQTSDTMNQYNNIP